MSQNKAFTLIEMLVVVAIIAILAGIALPTYQKNTTQVKVSRALSLLDKLAHDLIVTYNANGAMPATFNNISGAGGGGYGAFNVVDQSAFLHYDNGSTWSHKGALVQLSLPSNIGEAIPGFVASTNGADGVHDSIALGLYDDNGIFKLYCGQWNNSNKYVPLDYLPAGCNNSNFAAAVMGP